MASWDGDGNLSWEGDASLLSTDGPNRARVRVQPASGLVVRLVHTEEANPLRNLSLVPVAYEGNATIFHPRFLEMLNGTRVLRFSSWQMVAAGNRRSSSHQRLRLKR